MSLAFSVEGFLFYVHLHGDDKFKVNRTLFILDFGATIVFLLAVESVCLSDGSRLSDKGGGGGGSGHPDLEIRGEAGLQKNFSALRASVWSGPSPRSAIVPPL